MEINVREGRVNFSAEPSKSTKKAERVGWNLEVIFRTNNCLIFLFSSTSTINPLLLTLTDEGRAEI